MAADDTARFEVGVQRSGRFVTVVLRGDLDLLTAPVVDARLGGEVGRGDRVTLDLRGLDFMDSSGIRVLLRLHRRARDEQWTLRLRNLRPAVRRTLELAGLSDLFALGGAA